MRDEAVDHRGGSMGAQGATEMVDLPLDLMLSSENVLENLSQAKGSSWLTDAMQIQGIQFMSTPLPKINTT